MNVTALVLPVKSVKSAENIADSSSKVIFDTATTISAQSSLTSDRITSADFQTKHPLQDAWTWWFDNPKKKTNQTNWSDNLKKVYTFSTVEDFWSLWNNIKGAHELSSGSNYHLFKEGIEPKWEDPHNVRGGKWVVQIKPSQRTASLNQLWLWIALACIGVTFDEDDTQIIGVVVSVRKQMDKISLWTREAKDEGAVRRIGDKFKEILQLPASIKLGYQVHADALDNNNSFANRNRFEL